MTDRKAFAGQVVRIKENAVHPQDANFGGSLFHVEDYWDTLTGSSWMDADGNPAAIVYGLRAGFFGLPTDNNVLYGKIRHEGEALSLGHIVHVSEIEEING